MRWLALVLAVALGAGGCAPRGADSGEYLFLFVWEVNNRAVRGAPVALDGEPGAEFDPGQRTVRVARREELPGAGARALVLHRADSLDLTLASRAFPIYRLPARVPVDSPLRRPGRVLDRSGRPLALSNVVDEATRLLPGPLAVKAIEEDGTAVLGWGEEEFRLAPGGGWALALARGRSGDVAVIGNGPGWEGSVREHLHRGDALTVLRVYNHGWWPRERVTLAAGS